MAQELNQVRINKITKALYDQYVANGTITEEMQTNEVWIFTDVEAFTTAEKEKLAGIEAGAQVNPVKLSELTNDVGFVTKAVNDLTNYYQKSETFTKTEVQNLINAITTMNVEAVDALPTTGSANTIYLVPKGENQTNNVRDEYLYVNGAWEKIGDTEINLSNYALKSELPTKTSQLTNDSNFVVDASYVHTDNNFSTAEKTKLANVADGANANVIEVVKVNGVAQTVTNKAVNVVVPTVVTKIW